MSKLSTVWITPFVWIQSAVKMVEYPEKSYFTRNFQEISIKIEKIKKLKFLPFTIVWLFEVVKLRFSPSNEATEDPL